MNEIFESSGIDCSGVLDKTSESILVVDRGDEIIFANEKAEEELNHRERNLKGRDISTNLQIKRDAEQSSRGELPTSLALSQEEEATGTEEAFWEKDGARIPVKYSTSPLRNSMGKIIGAIVTIKNATRENELKQKLSYYRDHDQLTGLFNHLKFREKLDDKLNMSSSGVVMLLDMDRFKEVNNSFGPGIADNLLSNLADLLQNQLKEDDILARFGGDEFAILSSGKDRVEAREMVKEIIQSVRGFGFQTKGTDLQATVSIGFTTYPDQGETSKDLLSKADMALSQAKKSGRNQFKAYDPDRDSQDEVKSRVGWVRKIDTAIKKNNFVLYAQPILNLASEEISHYEVLIRMSKGSDGLISPGEFLPIAEKFGLSRDIDKWVVNETLKSIPKDCKTTAQQFAINLSGQSMTDNELLDWLKADQSVRGENFENILFEVTETAALSNINSANNFISTLKSQGSKFALDDFGMGFSSFNYLKKLSVDYLKIDGSFIQDLPRDSMNQNLVQSIVEVAHKLHKETIAEFVEDEETLQMVKNYGSDHAQGYFIGRPQPLRSLF
ncbi:EAL domain-containing protein [Candidatus Bipolaricaulota bacterium]|nr:EAL domain-containing protein [Candidatus Bipolaricaulota bacterium]